MDSPGAFEVFGLTDRGQTRLVNEDQFLIAQLDPSAWIHQASLRLDDNTRLFGHSRGRLLLVADGMGGHASGKAASLIAVQFAVNHVLNAMPWFVEPDETGEKALETALRRTLQRCQDAIVRLSQGNPQREGMGSTLTMAYACWPSLYVAHAGDSRCYRLRGSDLERITTDQTVAQLVRDQDGVDSSVTGDPGLGEVLWNALGAGSDQLLSEVYKTRLRIGDALLLCTDGLTRYLDDQDLREVLQGNSSAEEACRTLVETANRRGGADNITAVVAYIRRLDDAAGQGAPLEAAEPESDASARISR